MCGAFVDRAKSKTGAIVFNSNTTTTMSFIIALFKLHASCMDFCQHTTVVGSNEGSFESKPILPVYE